MIIWILMVFGHGDFSAVGQPAIAFYSDRACWERVLELEHTRVPGTQLRCVPVKVMDRP
jgi:hypothetical protein